MIDVETRKALFKDYENCRYFKVTKEGKVVKDFELDLIGIVIDKNCVVSARWTWDKYDSQCEIAEIDKVRFAYSDHIEGVFTSEQKAVDATKAWYKNQTKEHIKELEEQLAKLKQELE